MSMTLDEWIIEPAGYDGFPKNDLVRGLSWGFDVVSIEALAAAITELVLTGTALFDYTALLLATTDMLLTGTARFSMRSTVQNVTPKS